MVTIQEKVVPDNMEDSIAESNEECKTEPIVFIEVYVDHENYQNEVGIDNALTSDDVSNQKETEGINAGEVEEAEHSEEKEAKITINHDEVDDPAHISSRAEPGTSFMNLNRIQIKKEPNEDGDEEENEEAGTEAHISGVSIKMEDFEELEESSNYIVKEENFGEELEYSEETDNKLNYDRRDIAIVCNIDENSSDNCPFNECLKCSKFESDLASLLKHDCIKKANSGECVICESISKQVSDMKFHLNMAHDNIVRPVTEPHFAFPFPCKWCSKTFATEYRLEVHKFIHRLIKTYKCRECEKKFVKFESVVKHELLHPELVNFPRKAEYLGQLFTCPACELKFATPQLLADHKKIHASYFCSQCHMTFSKKYTLVEHIKKKHVEKQSFECPECKRVCQNALTLKRHIRVVHKTSTDLV